MTAVLWYIGAGGFLVAGIAMGIANQPALAAAFCSIAAAFIVLAVRQQRKGSSRS